MVEVSIGLAFLAGVASFLAPCVLPLVPAYLGYLSGYAVVKPEGRTWRERFFIVAHALAFVGGFSVVFVILGLAVGRLGQWLRGEWLRYAGGALIIFFGLALMRLLHLPFLDYEARLQWQGRREWGFLSSFLVGMVFAAGWTPCVGPALSAILTLSAQSSTAARGAVLLAAYSAGIGTPFVLAALLVDRLAGAVQRMGRYLPAVQKILGVVLVLVGVILISDSFNVIGQWLEQWGIGWDLKI